MANKTNMIDDNFTAGDFKTFRVLTKIHLGALGRDLDRNAVIGFDGTVLRHGTQDLTFPALRGAIKVGWVVPDSSTISEYTPRPAGIQMGDAVSKGEVRAMRTASVEVSADEQDAGAVQRKIQVSAPATPQKNEGLSADGVIVGKLKTPSKFPAVEIGMDDRQIVLGLDSKSRAILEKIPPAIAGDLLTDLLPNAIGTGRPTPGIAGEEQIIEVIPRVLVTQTVIAPVATEVRGISNLITDLQGQITTMSDDIAKIHKMLAKVSPAENSKPKTKVQRGSPPVELPDAQSTPPAVQTSGETQIEIGAWDMKRHWKARVKNALDLYGGDPAKIGAIMALEVDSVRMGIQHGLTRRADPNGPVGTGNGKTVIDLPLHI